MTNVEMITKLMEHNKTGPLMQAFVIEAILHYAEQVQANPLPENGFISARVWRECADTAMDAINNHLKGPRS